MILDIYNDSIKYSIKNSKSLLYFGLTLFSTFIIWMAYILILIHYQDANLNLKFASLIVPSLLTLIPIFLFLGYGMYSYIKCRSMVRTAVRLTVNETSGNVRRTIKIWECDCIPSPFVLGIFCPQIYIPFRMKEEEQQYILAHESWHIRRHDPLWKLIAFVLLAVYWWNPLAWIAFFYMTRDMEMSCDEAVLAQFGNQIKKGYSASLLAFAMERHPYSFAPVAFGEADAGRSNLVICQDDF